VLDDTNVPKVICPIINSHSVQPQCKTAINTLFQCEQYADTDLQAYEKCRQYQRMIHHDIVTPNGQLIPMAYEMDNEGPEVMRLALLKAGSNCGSCINTPLHDF
jgi:hypothetical protein